jgi:hypothetical protein
MPDQPRRMVPDVRWQPGEARCGECGFDWGIPVGHAIDLVSDAPAQVATALDRAGSTSTKSPGNGAWSANAYAWHLVDVLRIGAERLWQVELDPTRPLGCWDERELAAARGYDRLSPLVAGRALRDAAATWMVAARGVPSDATVDHDEDGTMTAADVIRRNAHEARHHVMDIGRVTPP